MQIFTTRKREGEFGHWEPIYIGTQEDPLFDERLSWEGKSDKMTQVYIMCLLNYDFNILSNAFLVHKPGIKELKDAERKDLEQINLEIIEREILPEIDAVYGRNRKCRI